MSQELEMGMAQMDQLKAQIDSLKMQRDSLGTVALDYERAIAVLEGIKKGSSDEVLLPIGGQVYVRSRMMGMEKCLVEQGAGIIMDVDLDTGIKQISERKEKVLQAVSSLDGSINELVKRYQDTSNRTQQLYNEQRMSGEGPEKTF